MQIVNDFKSTTTSARAHALPKEDDSTQYAPLLVSDPLWEHKASTRSSTVDDDDEAPQLAPPAGKGTVSPKSTQYLRSF